MLKDKKLFLFDIDGTLAVEDTLYNGSFELLGLIKEYGGQSFFITNNSTKGRADYVKKFARWGIAADGSQFVTAGYMAQELLKSQYPEDKIFVVGTASFCGELRNAGLRITEKPEKDTRCVLVAYDNELRYEKLVNACELLADKKVRYFATNPDKACPARFGFVPDCGAICKMLEYASGRVPEYIGKPNRSVVERCMMIAGIKDKGEVLVVGDRLYTDIACGVNAGVETCVVYTGEAKPETVRISEWQPDYRYDAIKGLYEELKNLWTGRKA